MDSPNSNHSSDSHRTRRAASPLRLRADQSRTPEGLGYLEEAIESKCRVRGRLVRDLVRLEFATPEVLLMPTPAATPKADAASNALGELLLAEQLAEQLADLRD